MIFFVSNQPELFESEAYSKMSIEQSLKILNEWDMFQFDSETSGRDAHVNDILLIQFGDIKGENQIVVDVTTISPLIYKDYIESHYMVGQNLKFDIQFLYNYNIIPLKVYDTMVVEQLLHLGYSSNPSEDSFISVSLSAIAQRRLGIYIDKTVRGEIIWRGIDTEVIVYAANDVKYLGDIMQSQLTECKNKGCLVGAKLECDFVPVISYLEWCGIRLDVNKWKVKMAKDLKGLEEAREALNSFVINHPNLQEFTYINNQGDLFSGFDTSPKCTISWTSSQQVIKVAKKLGFDVVMQDKNTGEDKESVIEKHLKKQKGINDEFLRLYFGKGEEGDDNYFPGHQGMAKLVTSFGKNHLNAINPKTGRIHTQYKQLGADTGRMSSGSKQNNSDLAKLKSLPVNPSSKQKKQGLACPYPNMQQLPSDEFTRSCFIPNEGNLWVSCDYAAIESRLGADIYKEKAMIEEFLYGSGDIHSLCAYMVYIDKIPRDTPIKSIKKLYPHLRKEVKAVEFSQQFGGSAFAIQNAMGCTLEKAEAFAKAYSDGFKGISTFKSKASELVRKNGYILLNPITGHKTYWWNHKDWIEEHKSFTREFWDNYKLVHKGTDDEVAKKVSKHFKIASKWDRKALNSVTQGTGAIILKDSQIEVFKWVVFNGFFGKILLNNLTHDESNWEFPKEITNFPNILQDFMESSAAKYCKSLPIPAEPEVDVCWKH